MPGMYAAADYDLAGFAVGAVERGLALPRDDIAIGDVLIGLASSGVHSNGYSLIRRILAQSGADLRSLKVGGRRLADALLEPTRIYVKPVLALQRSVRLKGLAHITGGGLPGNVPRVLPPRLAARLDASAWRWPPLFRWLQQRGRITDDEMLRVFNCGIGMVAVVRAADAARALRRLDASGVPAWRIGEIVRRRPREPQVIINRKA